MGNKNLEAKIEKVEMFLERKAFPLVVGGIVGAYFAGVQIPVSIDELAIGSAVGLGIANHFYRRNHPRQPAEQSQSTTDPTHTDKELQELFGSSYSPRLERWAKKAAAFFHREKVDIAYIALNGTLGTFIGYLSGNAYHIIK